MASVPAVAAKPSRPLVIWEPPATSPGATGIASRPCGGARRAGSIAGFVVAVLFAFMNDGDVPPESADPWLIMSAVPTLLAGTLGGLLFGPRGWRARSDGDWVRVILRLAITAVVLGAFLTGLGMGVSAGLAADGPGEAFRVVVALTLVTVLFGVPILGLFMLPLTLAASVIWSLLMVVLRSRAGAIGT